MQYDVDAHARRVRHARGAPARDGGLHRGVGGQDTTEGSPPQDREGEGPCWGLQRAHGALRPQAPQGLTRGSGSRGLRLLRRALCQRPPPGMVLPAVRRSEASAAPQARVGRHGNAPRTPDCGRGHRAPLLLRAPRRDTRSGLRRLPRTGPSGGRHHSVRREARVWHQGATGAPTRLRLLAD